jgi:hypothetical protein
VESISSDVPEIVEHVVCEEEEVQNVPNVITDELHPTEPPSFSRISASEEPRLRSLLIPVPILARFVEGKTKLKKELAGLSLGDHAWYLKTCDDKGVGLVKVHCCECAKDFGTGKWDHHNATVLNLFSNFTKSHISSS